MKPPITVLIAAAAGLLLALAAPRAHASKAQGIDVNSYQGSITWSSVYASGVRFAFAKATEGTYYQDPKFTAYTTHGKAAGLQMGAYHFAHPDLDCPSSEANYFWNFAGAYIIADGKSLSPALDFEVFSGVSCQPNYTAWLNAWASKVQAKTSHTLHPVLFTDACSGACGLTTSCTLGEWIAAPQGLGAGSPWSNCPCCNWVAPCTTGGWSYWLYSSSGSVPGISGNCDLDEYNGDLSSLIANEGVH